MVIMYASNSVLRKNAFMAFKKVKLLSLSCFTEKGTSSCQHENYCAKFLSHNLVW